MEKSIENIWSEGFLKPDALVAPKVIDLYNRKSELLVDKLMRTMKMDLYSIIPVGLGMGIWLYFLGSFVLVILMAVLLSIAFFLSLWQYKKFKKIDTSIDSYQYLTQFLSALKNVISFFTKFFAFGYPLLSFPVFWIMFKDTDWAQEMAGNPLPLVILFIWAALIFLGLTGVLGYRFAVLLVYGRMLNKLKEIIKDMEELRK